jgi:hypothetical protein
MTRLGRFGKLFAELLCKFGGIPEIEIVDVCVLRNDRLNSAAHPIGSLALGHPDRLKQFVNVTRLDLGDRQLADCRIGISLKRGWPLVAVLLAPSRPLRPNVGLSAFLERWCRSLRFDSLGLLTGLAAFPDDVHPARTAVALHP